MNHTFVESGLAITALYATRRVHGGRLLSVVDSCKRGFFLFECTDSYEATPLVDSA